MKDFGTVLVVAAHPDDEVLGCGGTIARLAREGCKVTIAILGEGITSRHEKRDQADPAELEQLRGCSRRAAEMLGAADLRLFGFPDNRFDTVPLLEVIKTVEELVQEVKPAAVYTHHGGDLNIDHVITHRAVLTATRPVADNPVQAVYAFEVPSSTDWAFGAVGDLFRPNVFVDITETLELKLRAMACYEGESRTFPHPRSPEALRAGAQRWGSVAGCGSGEVFVLERSVWNTV